MSSLEELPNQIEYLMARRMKKLQGRNIMKAYTVFLEAAKDESLPDDDDTERF